MLNHKSRPIAGITPLVLSTGFALL